VGKTGISLRDLFSFQTIAIMGLGTAAGWAVEKWQEVSKAQDEAVANATKAFGNIKALQDQAKIDAAAAQGALEAELGKAEETMSALETMSSRRIAIYTAQIAAANKLAAAQDEIVKGRIREDEASGSLTHEQAAAQLAGIEQRAAWRTADGGAAGSAKAIEEMQLMLTNAHLLIGQTRAQYEAAKQEADAIKGQGKKADDSLTSLPEKSKDLASKLVEANEKLLDIQNITGPRGFWAALNPFGSRSGAMEEQQAEISRLSKEKGDVDKQIEQAQRAKRASAGALPGAEETVSQLHETLIKMTAAIETLPGKIAQATQIHDIQQGAEHGVESMQDAVAGAKSAMQRADQVLSQSAGVNSGTPEARSLILRLVNVVHQALDAREAEQRAGIEHDAALWQRITNVENLARQLGYRGRYNRDNG
jgi:hypothetical protein